MNKHALRVRPDKVGSVCLPLNLRPYLTVSPELVVEEGVAIVGRVLTISHTYGHLELTSGRPALLVPGDLVVGVLGARAALRGFCGRVPQRLTRGDTVFLLNKGGVIGESSGATVGLGEPIRLEVIGTPIRDGKPLRLLDYAITPVKQLPPKMPPVLVVAATCMHAGKTSAAGVVIHHLTSRGLCVHAGKATGVAAQGDLLSFIDNGAAKIASFVDVGLPSTCDHKDMPDVTRTLLAHLAEEDPDVIVLELGDGLMGAYGVDDIVEDAELLEAFTGALVAANDVIGGHAAANILQQRGVPVVAITGPATDNEAGRGRLALLGFPAANIFQQARKLCELVDISFGFEVEESP
ncbi:MAG: hypothetical protein JRH20_00550 [Deltaproteobacteria bacterium]|nr:hypothetical protein [Deltaproteobacteria bacterium]